MCADRRLSALPLMLLLLLSLLLIALPATEEAMPKSVQLWRAKIQTELKVPDLRPAISAALSEPSSCVPAGAVTLSVINRHHAKIRPLQFALLQDEACFMRRMISVCYNVTDKFGTCVHSSFAIPPSDFKRSNYANLIWAKWRIIAESLVLARAVLWIDADVLLLRNPWAALSGAGTSITAYDIRYQSERRCGTGECSELSSSCAVLNGGQLLVSSAKLAWQIYRLRPPKLTNTADLDQDYADAIIRRNGSGFSFCPLPGNYFAHCWIIKRRAEKRLGERPVPLVPLCGRVTHHYNCVTTRKAKGQEMQAMIREWSEKCQK